MPVPYTERRRRREQLAEGLPPGLRGRIALRHVETVCKFPPVTQRTLAEALDAGARVPAAIAYLKENPEASLSEVVRNCRKHRRRLEGDGDLPAAQHAGPALRELTDLLEYCYPDMPRITAEAMAGSEFLSGVLEVLRAQRACFAARQAESDFVLVVLCGLALKTREHLDQIISQKSIYRQALRQSGVPWPGVDGASRSHINISNNA